MNLRKQIAQNLMARDTVLRYCAHRMTEGKIKVIEKSEQIIATARSYIGTRFRHQGRRKANGADRGGVDCLGLLVCVADECGLMKYDVKLSSYDETDYGHIPNAKRLFAGLNRHLDVVAVEDMQPADVLLMNIDRNPQHVGVVGDGADYLTLIHAYAPARGVVEHRLDEEWLGRVKAVFRF